MNQMTVLIMSNGGTVGTSLVKCLKDSEDVVVISADSNEFYPSLYLAEHREVLPDITSPTYIKVVERIIKEQSINAVIVASDSIMQHHLEDLFNLKVELISPKKEVVETFIDKYKTHEYFKEHLRDMNDLRIPDTHLIEGTESPIKFPVFVKPIHGSMSQNTFLVENEKEYEVLVEKYNMLDKYIVQEYIDSDFIEYTVSALMDKSKRMKSLIAFKRRLSPRLGASIQVEHDPDNHQFKKIREISHSIVEKLDTQGPLNIQYRIDKNGNIYVIEINPRFSSTVIFRHMMGINEPHLLLKNFLQGVEIEVEIPTTRFIGIRYLEELVIPLR